MAERCHVIHSIGDSDGPLPNAPLHIRRTELGTNLRTSFRSLHKSPKLVKPHQPCQVSQRRLCDIHQDYKRYIFQHRGYPGKTYVCPFLMHSNPVSLSFVSMTVFGYSYQASSATVSLMLKLNKWHHLHCGRRHPVSRSF